MADVVQHSLNVDSKQVEDALVRLTVAFKAPQDALAELTADLNALNTETAKVNITSKALGEGLVNITASLKAPASDAAQLSSRMLDVANSTKLAADALKSLTQVEQQKRGVQISTAGQEEVRRAIAAQNAERTLGLQQITAAQTEEQRQRIRGLQQIAAIEAEGQRQRLVGLQQIAAGQEDIKRRAAEEVAIRRVATQQIAAASANIKFDFAQQFQNMPVNRIDAFNRLMLGGAQNVAAYRDRMTEAQNSSRIFASILLSQPLTALKTLATDSRAAGAAVAFLKAELEFVVASRFGAIAIGFLVFGTITKVIKESFAALAEFEDKFAKIQALNIGVANSAQLNAQAQAFLRNTAIQTGISLGELTDKYLNAASATETAAVAQAVFTNSLTLAKATNADIKDVTLQLVGVYNVFGQQLKSVGTETDIVRVMASQLFTAFGRSAGTGQDFTQALKFTAASASIANISFIRLLGVVGLLNDRMERAGQGGRGFNQVLRTISQKADQFSEAFGLGLTREQITEAPIAALELLRQKFQEGSINAVQLRANIVDIFPRNATNVVYDIVAANDALIKKYEELAQKTIDIKDVNALLFDTLVTKAGQAKNILAETFIGAVGGADTFKGLVDQANRVLAAGGAAAVTLGGGIFQIAAATAGASQTTGQLIIDLATGDFQFLRTKALADQTSNAFFGIGNASLESAGLLGKFALGLKDSEKPFEDLKNKANEATAEIDRLGAALLKTVSDKEIHAPTALQQLELDLARNLTVELDKQVKVRQEIVDKAELAFKIALTPSDKASKERELLTALKALEDTRMNALKDANEKILLQSEQLTEKQRSQAVVSQEFAAQEIAARRGIIAALQGEQAQVEALAEARQISAKESSRQLVQLQREQNAQLQLIKSVAEAANKADKERLDAAKRVREAQDKVADTAQAVVKAQRAQADQRRITIETEAAGQSRILLAAQLDATDSVLKQLDVVRAAQEIANLPLKERIQLLEQERGLLDKLKSTEQQRLELEIEFGSQLPKLLAAQERFARRVLQDPVRREAAEKAAALAGNPTDEGVIHEVAKARQLRELAVFTAGDRKKEVEALKGQNDLRIKQEQAFTEQLATQLADRAKVEQDAEATTAKAIQEAGQALADQQGLFDKQKTIGPRPPLPDLFHRDVQIYILPDGSFTNLPPITSPPVKAFPLPATPSESLRILPQSLPEQDTILQEFRRGVQDISLGLAEDLVSPFRQAREQVQLLKADLQTLGAAIPEVVSRSGASLIDVVEEKLTDRIARELAFPTWT